jgi:N-acetylglucosaminyldiphosphoundecaprenol N-acetyl-beta-D-mannosaminyltransferase
MYLRYGDPSWDSPESSDPPPARRPDARHPRRAPSGASRLPSIILHNVELHAVTERQAIDHLLDELDAGRGGVVITPNLDHLRRCQTDVHFDALVSEADLVVADGMPLVWASRLQGTPLPERVAGSSLISTLSEAAAKRGRSVYLLGGARETAKGAAAILAGRYEGLRVAGTFSPAVGFEHEPAQVEEIRQRLAASGADIVMLGLGRPSRSASSRSFAARCRGRGGSAWG